MSENAKQIVVEDNYTALVRVALERAGGNVDKAKTLLRRNRRVRRYALELGLHMLVRQDYRHEKHCAIVAIDNGAGDERRRRGAERRDASFYETYTIGLRPIGDFTYAEIQAHYTMRVAQALSNAKHIEFLRLVLGAMRPDGGTVRDQISLPQLDRFKAEAKI